eukprot:9345350-Karenia_brevis.AAC.1
MDLDETVVSKAMHMNFVKMANLTPTNKTVKNAQPPDDGLEMKKWWSRAYPLMRISKWNALLKTIGHMGPEVDNKEDCL